MNYIAIYLAVGLTFIGVNLSMICFVYDLGSHAS